MDRKEVEKVENELEEKIEEMHLEKEKLSCDFSPKGKRLNYYVKLLRHNLLRNRYVTAHEIIICLAC